jgi:hypothetical protein
MDGKTRATLSSLSCVDVYFRVQSVCCVVLCCAEKVAVKLKKEGK